MSDSVNSLPDICLTSLSNSGEAAEVPSAQEPPQGQIKPTPSFVLPTDGGRNTDLGKKLLKEGLITSSALSQAYAHQLLNGGRLGTLLVELKLLDEEVVGKAVAQILGVEFWSPKTLDTPANVIPLIPDSLIRKHEVIPIKIEGPTLVVGMVDPSDLQAIDDIKFASRMASVRPRLITESLFQRYIGQKKAEVAAQAAITTIEDAPTDLTSIEMPEINLEAEKADEDQPVNVFQIESEASQAPVVRLVNYIIVESIRKRASDIHIEPYEHTFRIRFRIDGMLHPIMNPPAKLHAPFTSRIKILSAMDITERRKPLDGHMAIRFDGAVNHFRVSTLPTVFGEKCVIRLLKKEANLANIDKLGFAEDHLRSIKKVAHMSQGIILVTGPTGSGKTTTLHAVIHHINDPEINIVTLEDPVEMTIPGVNHVQVEPKGGVTFPSGLRSILRQDPDVVFVGEMRDEEVSRIAVKAALTGHLVLSTLHTNGAVETIARLMDQHIEPYLLASSLKLIVAQRLMRRLCTECAKTEPIPEAIIDEFGLTPAMYGVSRAQDMRHRVPGGCGECMNSGYRGRIAVYEVLVPEEKIQTVLRKGGDEESLMRVAKEIGMRSMLEEGRRKAIELTSSFAEVRRVLSAL